MSLTANEVDSCVTRSFAIFDWKKQPPTESMMDSFASHGIHNILRDTWYPVNDNLKSENWYMQILQHETPDLTAGRIQEIKEYLTVKAMLGNCTQFEKSVIAVLAGHDKYINIGVFRYIPKIYHDIKAKQLEEEKLDLIRPASNWVGTIKKRQNFQLTMLSKFEVKQPDLFKHFVIVKCIHDCVNLVTFFLNGRGATYGDAQSLAKIMSVSIGSQLNIRATVKSHEQDRYSECNATQLTRISWID